MIDIRRPLWLLLPVAALACASSTPTAQPDKDAPTAESNEPDPFEIVVKDWEGPTGEEGQVLVTVKAKGPFHINADYPHKVKLEDPPDGLTLPMREIKKEDAQLEGDQSITYTIPATASKAGEYQLKGQVRLSVCTDEQCRIAKKDMTAKVTAQ